jgi:aspartokinase-like uncharacterized kinase
MTRIPAPPLNVVKVGGGLASVPGALDRVCREIGSAAGSHRIVVVPGGGPFADTVREFDHCVGVSADASHWMAVLAMDQYAHVLVDRIPRAVLTEGPEAVLENCESGCVAVLAPSRWMRSADVLPHSWDVTSDSIAAFVAGALDATRLILIKPGPRRPEVVDPYFASALPHGMPYSVVGCDRLEELAETLSG